MQVTFDVPNDKLVEVAKAVQAVLMGTAAPVPTPTPAPTPALASYENDGQNIKLHVTGHAVPTPIIPGEMVGGYFRRVASFVGADPALEGALMMTASAWNIGKTGDPKLDMAIQVDAFANPTAYGVGQAGQAPVVAVPVQPPVVEMPVNVDNTATPTGVGNLVTLADWGPTESRRRFHAIPGNVYAVKAKMPPFAPVKNAAPQVVGSCSIVPAGAGDIQGHLSRSLEGFTPVPGGAGGTCYDRMDWTPEIADNDLYLIFALGPNQTETDVHIDFQIPTPGVRDANT